MPRYAIDFVSAPCGAGKSYGACRYIKDNLFEKNFLYVAPSLQLVSEIEARLRSMGVSPARDYERDAPEMREAGGDGGAGMGA